MNCQLHLPPSSGQQSTLLAQRVSWGEARVLVIDPATGCERFLPRAWLDLARLDPSGLLAAGRAILRLQT
jgi:hypothetical protein